MSPNPLIVLYDADCNLCQTAKHQLMAWDKTHRIDLIPLQDETVRERYPELPSPVTLKMVMHAISPDGRISAGASAYREIGRIISLRTLQGILLRLYSLMTLLPGVLPLAEIVYRQIAANRYKLSPQQRRDLKSSLDRR
jgi:predicted DCC family thiol-disulfide oxidoreductase YuxK